MRTTTMWRTSSSRRTQKALSRPDSSEDLLWRSTSRKRVMMRDPSRPASLEFTPSQRSASSRPTEVVTKRGGRRTLLHGRGRNSARCGRTSAMWLVFLLGSISCGYFNCLLAHALDTTTASATTTTSNVSRRRTEGGGLYERRRIKGIVEDLSIEEQRRRKLGGDKGGDKTSPEKGDPEGEEGTTDAPTAAPAATAMPSTNQTQPPTPRAPTRAPTASPTSNEPVDTTVLVSLSIGVAPARRLLQDEVSTSHEQQRSLNAALQSLVRDWVSIVISSNTSLQVETATRRRLQADYTLRYDPSESEVVSVLFGVDVSWWKHTIAYQLRHSSSLLLTEAEVSAVEQDATKAVQDAIHSGSLLSALRESAPQVLAVSVPGEELNQELWKEDEPSVPDTPAEEPDVPDSTFSSPTFSEGMSESWDSWNTRCWVGAGLLAATVLGTFLLMRQARERRTKRKREDVWGAALGTENDVNNLLNVGWKGNEDEVTAVYDKEKEGYKDNDSILLGGFQHTAVITNPSSATTTSQ